MANVISLSCFFICVCSCFSFFFLSVTSSFSLSGEKVEVSARTWCCNKVSATGRGVAIRCQPGRGAAWYCLPLDVVLLVSICYRTLCCCCVVSCAVFTGLLLLLCCLHLPRSVVLSSPASLCCVVFTCLVLSCCLYLPRSIASTASKSRTVSNNATRYGLMRLTGLIDSGKVALDVKHFSLNICHFNLLVE